MTTQKRSHEAIDRRAALTSLFAAGAALAVPDAAQAAEAAEADLDADLLALAPAIEAAERELEAVLEVRNRAEEKHFALRRPKPVEPDLDPAVTQVIMELAEQMRDAQKSELIGREAYREALRQWEADDERAEAESGLVEADAALEAVQDVVSELQSDVAETPARTLAGLIFKARYAAERDNDPVVMESIIGDLLALAEEA